ncbi:MAG TPA: hypothetical protein VFL91_09040 [Thermomicrobiales bacterium]|nr:hypothetical protein [Thermomicrobiales bacterium]
MAKLDAVSPTTPDSVEETTMTPTRTTQTRRLHARRLVALAAAVALLLALATAAAVRQARPAGPGSRAPVAAPALAHDGYVPAGLDYREDHRAAAPAKSEGSVGYREAHGLDAPAAAPGALPGLPPCLTGGGALCGPPAPGGDAPAGSPPPAPAPGQAPTAPHLVP